MAVNSRAEADNASNGIFAARAMDRGTLGEAAFHQMISLERRRTSRSQRSFLLMLVDLGEQSTTKQNRASLRKILSTLSSILRDTDVAGWYKEDSVVGVMFTEIAIENENAIPATLMNRVSHTLKKHLSQQQFRQLVISFHLVPDAHDLGSSARNSYPLVYRGVTAEPASPVATSKVASQTSF
jgi:hypothetical protein